MNQTPFNFEQAQAQLKPRIDYFYVVFMLALHVGAVAALFHFSLKGLVALVLCYCISGLGITVGYHRLLTHQSFKIPRFLEYLWAIAGSLALQGGPITWIAQHRQHHKESDDTLDPHNIREGFFHAHMGWIFKRYPQVYEEAQRKVFAKDLMSVPFYRWLERNAYIFSIPLALLLFAWGGWSAFLWGFCFRIVAVYHATWCVNSAAHRWGYRHFPHELATNNWWVAFIAFGEGWHNTHHALPSSARHGLRSWELDPSWICIWIMKKCGFASKIRLPRDEDLPWKSTEAPRKSFHLLSEKLSH